jgi:hypothetical protein
MFLCRKFHLTLNIPIYDGHLHLNQVVQNNQQDFVSVKVLSSKREFYLINNNHKPNEWLGLNPFPCLSHIHPEGELGSQLIIFDFVLIFTHDEVFFQ